MPLNTAAQHRVALGTDGVAFDGVGEVLLDQVAPERRVRTGRAFRDLREACVQRGIVDTARVERVDEGEEERRRAPVDAAPHVGLLRARDRLALRGDESLPAALVECRLEAGQCLRARARRAR